MDVSESSLGRVHVIDSGSGRLLHYAACLQKFHPVLYIDCANRFDPYGLYRMAGKDEDALERVHVVRPFTLYQLKDLVDAKLEGKIQGSGAESLLVSRPDAYAGEHIFGKDEYSAITGGITQAIKSLTRDYRLFTVVEMKGPDPISSASSVL